MSEENGLSGEQEERLAILIEECGEVLHMAGKVLRHGYESYNPVRSHRAYKVRNISLLESEIGDLTFAIKLLCAHDLHSVEIDEAAAKKRSNIRAYLHYEQELLNVDV